MGRMSEDALEAAHQAFRTAQEALQAVPRTVNDTVLDVCTNGEPVSRIAERIGQSTTSIWNALAAHGIPHPNTRTLPPDSTLVLAECRGPDRAPTWRAPGQGPDPRPAAS